MFEGYFLWQHCWETSPVVSPFIVKLTAEAKANQRKVLVKEHVKTMVKRASRRKKIESTRTQRQIDVLRPYFYQKKKSQKRAEMWGHGFLTKNIQFGSIAYYVLKEMDF